MPWRKWTENAGAKILSFVIAAGLWLSVTNRIEFEDTADFPVEYVNTPEGLSTIDPLPEVVHARVHGKGKFLRYRLRDGVCRVDLAGFQKGPNRITYTGEDVVLPEDVTVTRVEILEPRRATVEFDETVARDVAIVPAVVGAPDPRYVQVGRTFLNPARANVKGPRKLVDEIALVHTREIDIGGKKSTVRRDIKLVPSEWSTVEITPTSVEVGITIEPIVSQRIGNIGLHATGMPAAMKVAFRPANVAAEIEGARPVVEVVAKGDSVTLALETEAWAAGTFTLHVKEIHGADVRFEAMPPPPTGTELEPGPGSGAAPADTPVRKEFLGHLALPPDVEILSLDPDTFEVTVTGGGRSRGTP